MARPFSREQANEHIREIRRRKGVDNLDGQESDNMRDLDRTLNILSDQLYEKETHFLLELIQNADDNTFDEVTPSISFTCNSYNGRWTLEVECNEVGFKQENVEAICRIGDSTKRADQRTRGFIGEKGIGFKSVFKVANVVRIHSKAYSFMLDRRRRLGMIAPMVDRSPWQVTRDDRPETHMLLELNSESESRIIIDELVELEPQLLIFLRKVSKLHITTPGKEFRFKIEKLVEDQSFDGKETAMLTSTSARPSMTSSSFRRTTDKKYIIVRYQENILSTDTRRVNVRETEVVLAFPIDNDMRPLLQSQQTYAYLPINNYGFNYLIQGDFLLVANRESVDSSRWNDKVLKVVLTAFVSKAVSRFNENLSNRSTGVRPSVGLRYTWPLYLRDGGGTNTFWCRLNRWIFADLAIAEVLESRYNGRLCRPGTLYYIPQDYRSREMPLVEDEASAKCHLSFAYDAADADIFPILYQMGVKKMRINDLVRELRELITKNGISYLEARSRRWHTKIADLLRRQDNSALIADIPLIPLRDGRWVPFDEGHIFLEEDTSNSTIPGGLDIRLVQAEACQDPSRKAFFNWLGIRRCDRTEVCRMILERYSPLRQRTLIEAVDDVIYLFQTPHSANIPSIRHLLLLQASPTSYFKRGHDLYVEEPDNTTIISKFAHHPASNIWLLHPSYIAKAREIGEESEFVSWICSSLGVSTKPRLIDPRQRLTPEFEFLCANASKDLLLLLRESWDTYAFQLEPTDSRLNTSLSEMRVLCTDGQMHCLDQTVLPRELLKSAGPNLFFVDIPDAVDLRWNKLTHLGVLCSRTVTLYRRQLKALALLPVNDSTTTKAATEAAYTGLQSSMSGPSARVKEYFETYRLIFNPELNRWVNISECVWSGPRLSIVFDISSQYPEYGQLFQRYLELGNVDANHIVRELCTRSTTQIKRLKELLVLLSKYLKNPFPQNLITTLQGMAIFPVRTLDGSVVSMRYEDVWYIADRPSLLASFHGKLSLLDFDVKTARTLQPLIIALDKTSRLLSMADKPKLEKIGTPVYHEQKTMDLRLRAVHFSSLVAESSFEEKAQLLHSLSTLQVWVVPEVRLIHNVHGVLGVEEKGSVVFNNTDNTRLDIYISRNETTPAVINHALSRQFIQYCGIPNDQYLMVEPILSYPSEELHQFLNEHGLEESLDSLDTYMNDPQTNNGVNEDEGEDEIVEISRDSFVARRTRNPSRTTAPPEPDIEVSRPPSLLGERVPQSNGGILSVRRTTPLPSTRSSSFRTSSRERTNHADPVFGFNTDARNASSSGVRPSLLGDGVSDSNESSISADRADVLLSTTTPVMNPSRERMNRANPALESNIESFSGVRSERPPAQQGSNHARQLLSTVTDNDRRIGLLGEKLINNWLSQELQDWDPTRHWTSRNRNEVYASNQFLGNERDYADFTYADTRGNLTSLLSRCGYIQDTYTATWLRSPPTYHLEVKSTTASCNEPFYMSNNQVEKSRAWTFSWTSNVVPQNVYVLIRVYNLERQTPPGFKAYMDPWAMYLERKLSFFARGDYAVTSSTDEIDLT